MKSDKNCVKCKWSSTDQIGDRYCCNDESEHCADFVDKEMVCEEWESEESSSLEV